MLSELVSYEHSTDSNVHVFCHFLLLMHNYSHWDNLLYSRATSKSLLSNKQTYLLGARGSVVVKAL
jgi:hypothetical protein